jgi:hypothetical protein
MNRTNWYVQSRGNIVGPMSIDEIRRITTDPKVDQQILIIRDGWKGWLPLPEFRRFANQSGAEASPLTSATVAAPSSSTASTGDWFLSINGRQVGPLNDQQVESAIAAQSDRSRLYVIHRTWSGWKHVREMGLTNQGAKDAKPASPETRSGENIRLMSHLAKTEIRAERRQNPFRGGISGKVLIHNDQALVSTSAANISETGLFVKCSERPFAIGEVLKLTVKCNQIGQSFQAIGRIVRYEDSTGRNGPGFAIQMTEVGLSSRQSITRFLVEQKIKMIGVAS